jgi:hypothetical protein
MNGSSVRLPDNGSFIKAQIVRDLAHRWDVKSKPE